MKRVGNSLNQHYSKNHPGKQGFTGASLELQKKWRKKEGKISGYWLLNKNKKYSVSLLSIGEY